VFKWEQEEQQAVEALRATMLVAPVLALPNHNDPNVLNTDAPNSAIGGVFSQVQEGVERVIA